MRAPVQGKRGAANIRYEVAVAEALRFGDESFDAVCSALFFPHIDRELKRRRSARRHVR